MTMTIEYTYHPVGPDEPELVEVRLVDPDGHVVKSEHDYTCAHGGDCFRSYENDFAEYGCTYANPETIAEFYRGLWGYEQTSPWTWDNLDGCERSADVRAMGC